MNKLKIYFSVSSVLLLIVITVAIVSEYRSEWRSYQKQYNRLISDEGLKAKPVEIGIKQSWIEKLNVLDRCNTCHLGLNEKSLVNVKEPFKTHPTMYHNTNEFGCTICHEGQGRATTYKDAIGKVKYWDKPILSNEYLEGTCGKCHKEKSVPQAIVLSRGRKLVEDANCSGCHKIEGYQRKWIKNLTGIGTKVNRTWMMNWLKNPKTYFPKSRMPNFQFTDADVNNLSDFLLTYRNFPNEVELEPLPRLFIDISESEKENIIELGSTRFKEARCISCHSIEGKGGYVSTDLGKVASKINPQVLYNYIKYPKRFQPGVEMPRYRFSEKELVAVVLYIQSEFVDYEMEELPQHQTEANSYEKGLALFKKFNCTGCHNLSGFKGEEEIGPELSYIGSKNLYEIEFGKSDIEKSLPSYISKKLSSPRVFLETLKMPNFQFTDEEVNAIANALLGNTSNAIPNEFKVKQPPPSTFSPQGECGKLVDDLACFGCHTIFGRGRLVGTDLTFEASQTKRKWIEDYFKTPYSLRAILPERMPNLFLSNDETKTLVDYMEKVLINDSLERDIKIESTNIAEGKILYEKYGCSACHQVNLKGGYVGPPLDKLNTRLKAGWIFNWLKNPQAFIPGSIEPNNKFTDEQAEALTAFLMSLK